MFLTFCWKGDLHQVPVYKHPDHADTVEFDIKGLTRVHCLVIIDLFCITNNMQHLSH